MARNHIVQGSVSYTEIGNPTIVNGIVSGFSANDGIRIGNFPAATSNWELVINATEGPGASQSRAISMNGMYLRKINHYWNLYFQNGSESWAGQVSSSPFIKIVKTNNTAALYKSANGVNYSLVEDNLNVGDRLTDTGDVIFGQDSLAWDGSIDLKKTYIKVNGAAWFGPCPVEVKHLNHGTTVGYTKVGTPTISNGVVSGFSANDYLSLPNISNFQSFEQHVKFTTASLPSLNEMPIIGTQFLYARWGLKINSNNKIWANIRYQLDGSWDEIDTGSLDFTLEENTTYYGKLVFENNRFYCGISTDDANWTYSTGNTLPNGAVLAWPSTGTNNAGPLSIGGGTQYNAFNGSIDLNETYIKVNGKLWFFRPCVNYQVHNDKLVFADSGLCLSGPVTYTLVGSPTIMDGIVNGFTSSNYLVINGLFAPGSSSWEFVVKFKVNALKTQYILSRNLPTYRQLQISIDESGRVKFGLSTTGSSWDLGSSNYGSYRITADNWYYAKVAFDGSDYTFWVTDDKTNWGAAQQTISNSTPIYQDNGRIMFGGENWQGTPSTMLDGSIDLKETYAAFNSSLWFYGNNYASQNIAPVPSGFQVGSITTPSIGYIDIRTQTFTAAPTGSTIGKDE